MCSTHSDHSPDESSPNGFWANLRQPGPLSWKIRRIVANNAIKLARRQSCCGHDGEPGC
jgi:hypothetical protein